MKELKRQLYLRWDEILVMFFSQGAFFLFGELILVITVYILGENELIEAGTLLALIGPVFIMIFTGVCSVGQCFNLGIGMCDTRRRLVPALAAGSFLQFLAFSGVAYLLHHLELWLFRIFYKGAENEVSLAVLFQWKYILVACVFMAALQMLFSTLFLKLGRAALWIVWGVCMAVCLGLPRLTGAPELMKNIFLEITEAMALTGISVAAVILLLISYLLIRRQQVTL